MNHILTGAPLATYIAAIAFSFWLTSWIWIFIKNYLYLGQLDRLRRQNMRNKIDISRNMGGVGTSSKRSTQTSFSTNKTGMLQNGLSMSDHVQAEQVLPSRILLYSLGIYQIVFFCLVSYTLFFALPSAIPSEFMANFMRNYLGHVKNIIMIAYPTFLVLIITPFLLKGK